MIFRKCEQYILIIKFFIITDESEIALDIFLISFFIQTCCDAENTNLPTREVENFVIQKGPIMCQMEYITFPSKVRLL